MLRWKSKGRRLESAFPAQFQYPNYPHWCSHQIHQTCSCVPSLRVLACYCWFWLFAALKSISIAISLLGVGHSWVGVGDGYQRSLAFKHILHAICIYMLENVYLHLPTYLMPCCRMYLMLRCRTFICMCHTYLMQRSRI